MEKVSANFLTWINTFSFLALEIRCAITRTASLAMIILSLPLVEEKRYVYIKRLIDQLNELLDCCDPAS